jgi:hypothetical protein
MSRIMCTQTLWRALGNAGQPPRDVGEPTLAGGVFGTWAAKLFHYERRRLVLALNERTYLTLVFPLAPRARFRSQFATALTGALQDLGVPAAFIEQEVALLDFLPLARLTHRSMSGSLNDLEFLGRCELDYVRDLRRVQLNLNEVPHVKRDPCTAIQAVAELFRADIAPPTPQRVH